MQSFPCHHKHCTKRYTTPYTLRRHVRLKHKLKPQTISPAGVAPSTLPTISWTPSALTGTNTQALLEALQGLTRLLG